MPDNPVPPPTRAQQLGKVASKHIEAVLLAAGFVLGGLTAIVAGLLT